MSDLPNGRTDILVCSDNLLPSLHKMREFNFEELARPRANGDTRGRGVSTPSC